MKTENKFSLILIGFPIKHSFSKSYFLKKFSQQQINNRLQYENFPMKSLSEFNSVFRKFPNLIGANVTMPYKKDLLNYTSFLAPEVKAIGNLNTLVFLPNRKILGFNTDFIGLQRSLLDLLRKNSCESALILGTGASADTAAYTLNKYFQCEHIRFASRNPSAPEQIPYEQINPEEFELIINTTPLGMFPNIRNKPPFPYEKLSKRHKVFDLIYNPAETLFLKEAKKQGAQTMNGYKMLIEQAEASWKIWTKYFPEITSSKAT